MAELDSTTQRDGTVRVSTLELFFDLVFAFAITQITALVVADVGWASVGRGAILLGLLFPMYGGYACLANAAPPTSAGRSLLLMSAAAAFLVVALAVPDAFEGSGLAFGVAYLVVAMVHLGLFAQTIEAFGVDAIPHVAPANLVFAGLVVVGGAIGGSAEVVVWAIAAVGTWTVPFFSDVSGLLVDEGRFVERHGLLVIVALGEAIVATGIGARGLDVGWSLSVFAVLALALVGAMLWAYVGDGEGRRNVGFAALDAPRRAHVALMGFTQGHLAMLGAIVAASVGLRTAVAHPFDSLPTGAAVLLGAGVAIYLVGNGAFRRLVGLGSLGAGIALAAVAVVTIPIGTTTFAVLQLVVLVAVVSAAAFANGLSAPVRRRSLP